MPERFIEKFSSSEKHLPCNAGMFAEIKGKLLWFTIWKFAHKMLDYDEICETGRIPICCATKS